MRECGSEPHRNHFLPERKNWCLGITDGGDHPRLQLRRGCPAFSAACGVNCSAKLDALCTQHCLHSTKRIPGNSDALRLNKILLPEPFIRCKLVVQMIGL